MKYKRNWAWDTVITVVYANGDTVSGTATTDNKGRLIRVQFKSLGADECVEMTNTAYLRSLGVKEIHFTTPAMVTI